MSSIAHRGFVDLGMDVSKNSIAVAVLPPDRDVAEVDEIFHDAESVRRLIKQLGKPKEIWACNEAGPTGYDLQRLLASIGVRCDVVAPSLIPKGSGDRVKTDRAGCQAAGGAASGRRAHLRRHPHAFPRGRARSLSDPG